MTGPGAEDDPVAEAAPEPAAEPVDHGEPGGVVESRVARRRRALRPVPGRTAAIVTAAAVVVGVGIVSLAVPSPSPASLANVGPNFPLEFGPATMLYIIPDGRRLVPAG